MKVTYTEKGIPFDYKRIDTVKSFYAVSYWKPEGVSLLYFKLDRYNIRTVPEEDVIKIEE